MSNVWVRTWNIGFSNKRIVDGGSVLARLASYLFNFFLESFSFVEVHRSAPCVQSSRLIPKITNGSLVKGICSLEPLRFTSSNSMACPSMSISKTCYGNWYYNFYHYRFFLFLGRVRVRSVKSQFFNFYYKEEAVTFLWMYKFSTRKLVVKKFDT